MPIMPPHLTKADEPNYFMTVKYIQTNDSLSGVHVTFSTFIIIEICTAVTLETACHATNETDRSIYWNGITSRTC